MKCPICGKEIKHVNQDYMEHILMEERAFCEDENHFYGYEYVTGSTEESIGSVIITTHYSDPEDKQELVNKQYNAVIQLEKEHYKKKLSDA